MHVERFEIAHRFRGPPRSGNGGYTCGRIAKHLQGTVAVRLKAPPPLGAELRLESTEDEARLFHESTLVGEAKRSQLNLEAPPCPSYEEAEQAAQSFIGFKSHRFPGCFVCGPERTGGDGLCIFPGSLNNTTTFAAPWTPDLSLADESGNVKPEFFWSALDCTGAFALFPLPDGLAIVLGELAASIREVVKPGDRCVVLGWPLGVEGRKRLAGTAIYAPNGRLAALARAVWIEVPLSTWN
ncbi:hotdog fold domain-containing protein [Caenimonas soli]|uniref:hotdog fold domain-containing protein n=1 Tax=Caenimonas soli TaxID=2735555 RepID=UPI001557C1AD|nr:hotdog fold domain-containing protein [Caenimonas soli]NPC57591.1 hypothetical protein [Caenimonas soli]